MASLTAVTGNWHSTAASSTAFSGAATVAADEITIPNGVTVTIPSGISVVCRSLTVANGGTLIYAAATSALSIGDATAGTSNVALSIGSTATITLTGTGSMSFVSTNTTVQTITTNGKTLPAVTFNGLGGRWRLQDALTCGAITHTAGHFDTNSQTLNAINIISSNNNVRVLDFGSSAITLSQSAGHALSFANPTSATIGSTNTAVITISHQTGTVQLGNLDFKGTSFVFSSPTAQGNAAINTSNVQAAIIKDLTINVYGPGIAFDATSRLIITGTLTINGPNSIDQRAHLYCNGYSQTLAAMSVANWNLQNVDFQGMHFVGPLGSTITSDSFNRANGNLGSTDVADGGSTLAWSESDITSFQINSNIVTQVRSDLVDTVACVNMGSLTQYVEADITRGTGTQRHGLTVRSNGTSNNGICLYILGTNGTMSFSINGVAQQEPYLPVITGTQKVGLGITDAGAVIVKVDGVIKRVIPAGQFTSMPTGTYAGLYCRSGSFGGGFENFKAQTITKLSGTSIGDALFNSGVEFDAARTLYAVGSGTNVATGLSSTWADTSGGTPGSHPPLPQDDVIFDSNSATSYSVSALRFAKNFTATNYTGSMTAMNCTLYGSFTGGPNLSVTSNAVTLTFTGTVNNFIRNGCSFGHSVNLWYGNLFLLDDLITSRNISVSNGSSLNTNNFNITCNHLGTSSGSAPKVMNLGTSTINLTTTTTNESFAAHTFNATIRGENATFNIVNPSPNDRVFTVGNNTDWWCRYGTINYTVADSPGALIFGTAIQHNGIIGTLNVGPGRSIRFPARPTQQIGTLNINATPRVGVRLTGVAGSYISTPDSAATSITGDIDIRVRAAVNWTSSPLLTKYTTVGNQASYILATESTGRPRFYLSANGSTVLNVYETVSVPFSNYQAGWIRVTYRASDQRVQFFTASDSASMPSSWTQHGIDRTMTGVTSIFNSTAPVEIGSYTGGTVSAAGTFYWAQIRNGIDGTVVLDADLSQKPFGLASFNEGSSNAALMTVNGFIDDGRVVIESSTAGSAGSLQVGAISNLNYVDLKDIVINRDDTYIGATSVIRSNVKGVRRGPKTGMSMMMGV